MPELLKGLRLVEVASTIAVGFCARILGDLGGDVLRIEPTWQGDEVDREGFPNKNPTVAAAMSSHLNRGKTRIQAETLDDIASAIADCDVAVLNDKDALQLMNYGDIEKSRNLVLVVISPFGLDGPRREWVGDDLIAQAYGGGCMRNGLPLRPPLRAPAHVGDYETGLGAAVACLVGLIRVRRGGAGQLIDVAAAESWAKLQTGGSIVEFIFQGRVEQRAGRRYLGRGYPHAILRTRDGDARVICVQYEEWRRALKMMGNPGWGADARYSDRVENQVRYADELDALLEEWLMARSGEELLNSAVRFRVPWAPIRAGFDVLNEPQLCHRQYVEKSHDRVQTGHPVQVRRFDENARKNTTASHAQAEEAGANRSLVTGGMPLDGIRVLDFGWAWAGGLVGGILADYGADVIKVESRRRLDPMRRDRPLIGEERDLEQGSLHHNINRGKKSITIDITASAGADLVRQLSQKVDVVIENFSPGTMTERGLGPGELLGFNPRLVYLSMSAAGADGPLASMRSYAPVLHALSGMDALVGYEGEDALGLQHSLADPNAALHGALAVMASLLCRDRRGAGQYLDLSQLEAVIDPIVPYLLASQSDPTLLRPLGNRDPLGGFSGVYQCLGDDQWVAVSCTILGQVRALAEIIAYPLANGDVGDGQMEGLDRCLNNWARTQEKWVVANTLQNAGIPSAPLLNIEERFADEHFQTRECFIPVEHAVVGTEFVTGVPWRLVGSPGRVQLSAPLLGQHTREVLQDLLGLAPTQVSSLEAAGILR